MKLRNHISFWVICLVFLSLFFKNSIGSFAVSFYFVCLLLPSMILFSFLFNGILLPKYLASQKLGSFVLNLLYSLIISLYVQAILLLISFVVIHKFGIGQLSELTRHVKELAFFMVIIVLVQSLFLLIKKVRKRDLLLKEIAEDQVVPARIQVRSNRQMKNIDVDTIQYIESLSDYILIHTKNQEAVKVKMPISKFHGELPKSFWRIHRSFIINKNEIDSYGKDQIQIGANTLPISRKYKAEIQANLQKFQNGFNNISLD